MCDLIARFDEDMMRLYQRAHEEAGYTANRYHQMLIRNRGIETARILLHAPNVSEGYTALWELRRLDLTVEALIFDYPEYHELFTPEELETARTRLQTYGYSRAHAR